jgi:uncharacterized membrane protein YfhO/putative flippase GtrA
MLKLSLSGTTMYLFLKNRFDKDKWIILLFSTSYALIAYNVNYYFNIMWLDAVYLAPLILLGIDKIVDNKSSLLYGISLFIAIISNYYMGYMLCIFSCLYFIYQLINKFDLKKDKDKILSVIIKFGIASLLAGVSTFFILVPTIMDLQNSERAFGNLTSTNFSINFNLFDILSRTYISSHNNANVLSGRTVALYSGIITLPLVFFYFINRNFKLKEKLLDASMLLIFLLSVIIPYLNMVWHGMNFPNGFNYRFSFLFSLFLILIACKSFWHIKKIPLKNYLMFFIGYTLLSLTIILMDYPYLNYISVYISVACLGLYLVLLYNYGKERDGKNKLLIKSLLIIMVLSELFFNFFLSIRDYEVGYQSEFEGYMTILKGKIKEYEPQTNEFYRIEKNLSYTYLDSMLLNYPSTTVFLSTLNSKTINFFNNVGATAYQTSIDYQNGNTYIINSLLGLKYQIANNIYVPRYNIIDEFQFSKYTGLMYGMEMKNVDIYENPDALSLGYMVNSDIKKFTQFFIEGNKYTNFDFQNTILQTMMGNKKEYLKPLEIERIDPYNYVIDVTTDEDFYIMVPFDNKFAKKSYIKIYINDQFVKKYTLTDFGMFLIENKYPNDKIKLTVIPSNEYIKMAYPTSYYLDYENFKEDINNLKENQLMIDILEKNYMKGSINVSKDKNVLFTSIPYEDGWTIKVDGKKTDYYRVYDAFIAIDLKEGNHQIEFVYYPPGLKLGIIVSLISMLLFGLYIWKEKQIIKLITYIYNKYEQIVNYLIIGVLTTIVNFIAYVLFARVVGFDYIISSIISWIIAVLFAYITNKIFVFRSKTYTTNSFITEMYQFFKYRLVSLGIDLAIMFVLIDMIFIDDVIAKLIVQVVIVIVNYVFSKLFVFKD